MRRNEGRKKNKIIVVIIIIIIVVIIITPYEFFTPTFANNLSLESEWQQVFSGLLDSSQYSDRL